MDVAGAMIFVAITSVGSDWNGFFCSLFRIFAICMVVMTIIMINRNHVELNFFIDNEFSNEIG